MTSQRDFAWAFLHNLTPAEQATIYAEHVVPTPGWPFWQAALSMFTTATRVDYRRDRPPLLMIAGGADRTVTGRMNLDPPVGFLVVSDGASWV